MAKWLNNKNTCDFDQINLNQMFFRGPREFEFLGTLVDGAHWQGQKKMRRPDKSGRGGYQGLFIKQSPPTIKLDTFIKRYPFSFSLNEKTLIVFF